MTRVAGGGKNKGNVVARGKCPFCGSKSSFRKLHDSNESDINGPMIPVRCDGCRSVASIRLETEEIYPKSDIQGLDGLPEEIDQYYQEALRCLSVNSPNGATTLFRKTIHAVAIHYDLAEENSEKRIYDMIDELDEEGHITHKLRRALLATKDLGNDGAHINENEPDMEQAEAVRELIEAVLTSTVLTDRRIDFAREKHPNEYSDDGE